MTQPSPKPWNVVLERAAQHIDGGMRSFPLRNESDFIRYAYDPPNQQYQKLFWRQATVPQTQTGSPLCSASAGWLIPDETSDCKPVFIAHSTLAAIWLLRESLPNGCLSDDAWESLVTAAQSLAQGQRKDGEEEIPPSAQKATMASYKRRAVSTQEPPSPKRARTEIESQTQAAQGPSREASPVLSELSLSDISLHDEPVRVTTVTNNNRRAERNRARKAILRAEKQFLDLGLQSPSESAGRTEKAAYNSIEPKDAPTISWIMKQDVGSDTDLFHRNRSPYTTATSMLRRARSLGNSTAQENAAVFLQRWRTAGSPFSPAQTRLEDVPATQLTIQARGQDTTLANPIDREFCFTYGLVCQYETRLATVHVEYRWAMAFLGRTYANKVAALQQDDRLAGRGKKGDRQGRGKVRSEAQQSLLDLLYPDPTAATPNKKQALKNLLQRATRWYDAATTLGWGSLCLMPHDTVGNNWAEKTLTISEWHIWLELVKRVNSDACTASKALEEWLGSEGVGGGPISGKETLCIETEPLPVGTQVEEVQDSEDDEDEDEGLTPVQLSPAPAKRQRTLLEMFRPQES